MLKEGANPISVTMKDKENSRSATGSVYLMTDKHELVAWNTIEDSSINSGATGTLPINSKSIESGNDLEVTATSQDTNSLKVLSASYGTHVKITWTGVANPKGNFFFDGNASVLETQGSGSRQLVFSTCEQAYPGADVTCTPLHTVPVQSGEVMGDNILSLSHGGILAWTTNA